LFNNVFTPPPPPPVTTTDDEPPAPPVPPVLVDEVGGVQVTPTSQPQPSPTLVSEILQVRRLPTTGTGGPSEGGNVTPWVFAAAAATLAGLLAAAAIGRRLRNSSR
jgi:hypothetical protein